jgi:PhnB protein
MTTKALPAGYLTVTPYLTVQGAAELIEFLKQAFGAQEKERFLRPDGRVGHAEVWIGDSLIMLGEPKGCDPMPGSFYLYLDDVDAVYQQALATGATSAMEPTDQFWGDRQGGVRDRFGNLWWLATRVEEVDAEELMRRMAACCAK